jgi:23S rRNA (guanine745-N1)-methyltransferase
MTITLQSSEEISLLLCPVRGCGLPLRKEDRRAHCAAGHSFDRARSGYFNLLQPQERRSRNPGDTAEAVAARRRLHDRGVTEILKLGIAAMLGARRGDVVLDAGCGDGFYLGTLAGESGFEGHGIDISIPAVDAAARRYLDCEWIVGNADRFLPYADESFSHLISVTARMNPGEFRRVLRNGGCLLVAVAAPDDFIELRGVGRDRVERTVQEFAGSFRLMEQRRVTSRAELDEDAVRDVLQAIYRPMTAPEPGIRRVTMSLDLMKFQAS